MADTPRVTVPVELKKPDPLVINDGDGRLLFAIRSDGSVEGTGSEHEAAQRLVAAMRNIAPEMFEAHAPEGGAVPYGLNELFRKVRRRYPAAFNGRDPIAAHPPSLENATDLFLAACFAALAARSDDKPGRAVEATGAQAVIWNGQIVVSVDVDALPIILSGSIALNAVAGTFKVTDAAIFAKEICHALNAEKEDGTTRVHMMFDSAFNHAIDQGAEGVEEISEDEFESEASRLQAEATSALATREEAPAEAGEPAETGNGPLYDLVAFLRPEFREETKLHLARRTSDLLRAQPPAREVPAINIKCEADVGTAIGTTRLNVIRVEREDDGSLTAVTDHWPQAREEAQPPAWTEKWSGPCTVGNMIANLQTLPPEMPLYSAYHISMGEMPSLLKVKRPTLSRERVDGNDIRTGDESVPYSAVIWTQPRDFTEATHPAPDALREDLRDRYVAIALMVERAWTAGEPDHVIARIARKALAALQAEQKGGAA